jgi:hypothetical protein
MCWKTSNKKCPHFIQKTNADRIRAMSDEELAEMLSNACAFREYCYGCPAEKNCPQCPGESVGVWEEWLKQPVGE